VLTSSNHSADETGSLTDLGIRSIAYLISQAWWP